MLTVSKEIRSWAGVDSEKFSFSNLITRLKDFPILPQRYLPL